MIGYELEFGVYRIYLEDKNKVVWSRDVSFDENLLPLKESRGKIDNNQDEIEACMNEIEIESVSYEKPSTPPGSPTRT